MTLALRWCVLTAFGRFWYCIIFHLAHRQETGPYLIATKSLRLYQGPRFTDRFFWNGRRRQMHCQMTEICALRIRAL
jgi:hypothetical protein